MRIPPFLKNHGTIGFIAPSFACTTTPYVERYENAKKYFRHMNYKIFEGPNCHEASGLGMSNTPDKCGQELNDCMCDSNSDIIISCGGGELMCTAIPYMDFPRIKAAPPKWYMGYSDNTNFVFFSTTVCDTAAIYGECAASFGQEKWHRCHQDSLDLLKGKKTVFSNYELFEKEQSDTATNPLASYNLTAPTKISCDSGDVSFSGRLVGGCLDCLEGIAGTEFDHFNEFAEKYSDDGIIIFLESCELNTMGVIRALWRLKHCGWFNHKIKGFLIGRPMLIDNCDFGISMPQAFDYILKEFNAPIIHGMDIGHLPPQMPTVSGAFANVTFGRGQVTLAYDFNRDK